jgi:hypothetical protein
MFSLSYLAWSFRLVIFSLVTSEIIHPLFIQATFQTDGVILLRKESAHTVSVIFTTPLRHRYWKTLGTQLPIQTHLLRNSYTD